MGNKSSNNWLKDIYSELKNISKLLEEKEENNNNDKKDNKKELSNNTKLNDYDKIILKNLESRITILEEESSKYKIN